VTVAAGTWPALERRLEGQLVAMEPLAPEHEADLFAAGSDERVWRWIDEYVAVSRERFHDWMTEALEVSAAGVECALATVDLASGRAIGSSRYLAPSEPDLKVEIEDVFGEDDRVALRLRWNAEQTGYVQYGIVVFRFEGDRIAERWSAYMSAA